jgi:hypothetical protein
LKICSPALRERPRRTGFRGRKAERDGIQLNFPDTGLTAWQWFDENDQTGGITVQLRDKNGTVLDDVVADEYSPKHAALREFLATARRSAHNVPAIIEQVEKELASLKVSS